MAKEDKKEGITSYCLEYALTQTSKCNDCNKIIPRKSLRVAEIFRRNAKVKKFNAKHTWFHFKCWKCPELVLRIPITQFRGYPALQEKDQARVQKLIKYGLGACWKDIVKSEKEALGEEEEKPKKSKEIEDDVDMTEGLTGVQEKPAKKVTKKEKKTEETEKAEDKAKTEPKAKSTPKVKTTKTKPVGNVNKNKKPAVKQVHKPKEVVLPKQDQEELESIAKEFKALQK